MPPLSEKIKQEALELGFAGLGIVQADALDVESERLRKWLGQRFHGEMAWMAREPDKRADPRLLFPAAKSIIVGVLNYYTGHKHLDGDTGKISRYAWGDDYHDVLREKLTGLLELVKAEVPGAGGKICIDTAPFMDKAWAARAGLGWIGKNTNLITTQLGSWVFIGSLLLDIELDYDSAVVEDHCGTCNACLDACPTSAIVEPYVVDSRKCISYATIELRDEQLPSEIASNLNGWLYGCDICQDVCPWNRFETQSSETRFEPRNGEISVDPDSVITMEDSVYTERFRRSPMKRTKLAGLKRNAAALQEHNY